VAAESADPLGAAELPSDDEIALQVMKTKKRVVSEDRPFVERVSPFDMFVNAEATTMRDIRWVAQRIVRPLEEAKRDPRYQSSVRSKLSADDVTTGLVQMSGTERKKFNDQNERVVIWEFYDMERHQFMVFSDSSRDFLIKPRPIPYHAGHPYVLLRDHEVPDDFYAIGELEQIKPLVYEKNMNRTQMLNHKKKQNRKYLAWDGVLDSDAIQALRSDEDSEVVFVNRSFTGQLDDVMKPVPQLPVNADLYAVDQVIDADINEVSGPTPVRRRSSPRSRRSLPRSQRSCSASCNNT